MMVTKSTLPKTEWSKLRENFCLNMGDQYCQPIAVIGAVREKGVECLICFPKSVNVTKYKIFLNELRRVNIFDNILLV